MPTIEFRTYDEESHEFFRPVAAKEVTPEWWKKMKIRLDHRGRVSQTIRSCPSMQDWLTMGYYIISTVDIPVRNGLSWDWPDGDSRFTVGECENFSHSHPAAQLVDSIHYDGDENSIVKDAFKITNFWNIKTPPGYSVLFLDPFLFTNKYFSCWQGVIDTDGFNVNLDNAQCIFYPKVDHSFVIEAGTPLVQVFPFKREEWTATYFLASGKEFLEKNAIDDMSMQKWQRKRGLRDMDGNENDKLNIGGYRNAKIWKPKSKLYDKPVEQEPPPECPMHKKDFKEKQQDLTELNGDGNRDRGRYGEDVS